MKRIFLAAGVVAIMSGSVLAAPGTHCGPGETVWFNAALDGSSKTVSICGSSKLDGGDAWLQYRFGRPGRVELAFPEKPAGNMSAFTYRRYTRPGTTYLKLDFKNGGYTYAILEGFDDQADTPSSATLRVTRDSDGTEVAKHNLNMSTEPLNIMRLEYKVTTKPFDE